MYEKIEGRYNVADGSMKSNEVHPSRHLARPQVLLASSLSNAVRPVVAAAFHVLPVASGARTQFDTTYSALTETDRSAVDRLSMLM